MRTWRDQREDRTSEGRSVGNERGFGEITINWANSEGVEAMKGNEGCLEVTVSGNVRDI